VVVLACFLETTSAAAVQPIDHRVIDPDSDPRVHFLSSPLQPEMVSHIRHFSLQDPKLIESDRWKGSIVYKRIGCLVDNLLTNHGDIVR
jgi:hypothetical protein